MPRRSNDAEPPTSTVPPEHFENLYTANADPWRFATSWYERRKCALTVAGLPRKNYDNGFEAGCSIGLMTRQLALRCKTLLAVDSAPTAVRTARRNLTDVPNATIEHAVLPDELPDATFDLIIATEIYYFTNTDLTRTLDGLATLPRPDGDLVIAHWRAADRCACCSSRPPTLTSCSTTTSAPSNPASAHIATVHH